MVVQEVVGCGQIMFAIEVVTQVAAKNGCPIAGLVHMAQTNERHLLDEMPSCDFAANGVPKIGVKGVAKHDTAVKLRDDGELALIRGNVADKSKTDVMHYILLVRYIKVESCVKGGVDAVASEVVVVHVVEVEMDIRAIDLVVVKGGIAANTQIKGVIGRFAEKGLVKVGAGEGDARCDTEVIELELREIDTELVLLDVQVGVFFVVVHHHLVVLAAEVVCCIKVGHGHKGVGGGHIDARIVAQAC